MNPIKFGSPHLDTPSSRYNFCKLVFKSVKNKQKQTLNAMYTRSTTHSGTNSWAPPVSEAQQSTGLTSGELADGEFFDGVVGTDVLSITTRLD